MKTPRCLAAAACTFLIVGLSALNAAEPFFEGLGSYERKITTTSPEAQKYFNQGLRFLFGFNHGGAIRAFRAAAEADPHCAMAHWGVALANGPHINFPLVPPPAAEAAWSALTAAKANVANATPVERALIEALSARYANPQPEDRRPLDEAYASAMREAWKSHPDDPDIGVLFAEAMLDLRPWDQWTPDGKPQPGTEEVVQTLEAVLKLAPEHPFANHLFIHTVEASAHPEVANTAADRLRTLQPGLAHNVHMPSHIDIRCGRWHQAIESNTNAIRADKAYRAIVGPPRDLIVVYAAHNRHMLTYAAMMTGQSELALEHIRTMVAEIPESFLKEYALMAEGFVAMPYEVLLRFGRWDEMLKEPEPADYMPLSRALRHAARGVAFAAKGDTKQAREEQTLFEASAKAVPAEESFGNNPASAIVEIARRMLAGEVLYREGKVEEGLAELKAGVQAEDTLRYDEPPGWILPVRHSLGATLIKEARFAEAEQVYREDLRRLPENGWSLFGLAQSLKARGEEQEAAELDARFKKLWAKADITIGSSCLCQPGILASK
jgi:tetratricopeptide (TPR) repeat protein